MALDPRRSWSRRKAEDARDLKLDIIRPGRERPEYAAAEPPTLDGRAATVGRKGRALPLAPEDGPEDEDEPGAEAPDEGADGGD